MKIRLPIVLTLMVVCGRWMSVYSQTSYNFYFGDIHSQSWYSDGNKEKDTNTYKKPVAQAITYARDIANNMNFLGVSDHNHHESSDLHMNLGYWRAGNAEADSVNQDNVFVGMRGQEWGTISGGGHVLVYGTDKLFGWEAGNYDVFVTKSNYGMLFDSVKKYNGFCYLAHPQQSDYSGIFSNPYNASWDSVVMGTAMKNGPALDNVTTENDPSSTDYTSRYHDLLRLGYHVAPCANQDNHYTNFGRLNQQRTVVLATSLTKANVVDALRNRRAYATEDHDLQVRFEVGTHQIGEIFTMGGSIPIHVKAFEPDGDPISRIEIRYGIPGSGTAPTTLASVINQDSLVISQSQTVGTTYYYYAYVLNASGREAWTAPMWITITATTPPSAVSLISPSNNATNQPTSLTLQWSLSATATSYRVQVATDSTFASGMFLDDPAVIDTFRSISGFNVSTKYYWRVNASNSGGTSAYAGPWNFTTATPSYTLTASAGSNGSITPSGVVVVSSGENQSFTVIPNTGYHVDSVIVDGINQGGVTSYTFTNVTANHTISAKFAINTYTLTASASVNGSIAPSGNIVVNDGSSQSFTMLPDVGYHVDSVLVDGSSVGSVSDYTFTNITSAHTISARFGIDVYTISASSSPHGSISPQGTSSVNYGASQSYTIIPDTDYHVADVVVDGSSVGTVTVYTFQNTSANHTIAASFLINAFTIVAAADSHGIVSPTGLVGVDSGANQPFTITAQIGYHIDSVFVDGAYAGVESSYTFSNIQANHTIRAKFAINTYVLTASAGSNGSISPEGTIAVDYGADRTFVFGVHPDYVVDSVIVDGVSVGAVSSYTFNQIGSNHTVRVTFALAQVSTQYTLNASWNMVSVPVSVPDYKKSSLFPPATSDAFAYQGSYVAQTILSNGTGYWLKFDNAQALTIAGAIRTTEAISIYKGWNLIGSVSSPVSVSSISTNPSSLLLGNFFGYNGAYVVVSTIEPGKAYWVKATTDGTLMLSSNGTEAKSSTRLSSERMGERSAAFTFVDNADNKQTLYVEDSRGNKESESQFDLPPIPPNGSFDVRFWSQKYVECVKNDRSVQEFPVVIQASAYPLTLSWNITSSDNQFHYRLSDGVTAKLLSDHGRVVLSSEITNVKIIVSPSKASSLSKEFALFQNYPNPFNPSTRIQFDLPRQSIVTLKVYNIIGSEVASLIDHQTMVPGVYESKLDGSDLSSGIYFYRIAAEVIDGKNFQSVKKMLLMK
ncbi:MAG: T9SS type A sorting domain-containing protein [Ignavibacteria bacterium]|nr:T9SS type A sorting domain-containing protein [Ignavibacteria bacterium]